MINKTGIEWTDGTWNPVTGCTKVSAGCANCYAETLANRKFGEWAGRPFSEILLKHKKLEEPLKKKTPKKIFVNSMSDLFHKDVPDEFIHKAFDVMNRAHWHTFQVLTKRPERMLELSSKLNWSSNIWMGVSVENQKAADERIGKLIDIPSGKRFLSMEPLLEKVNISNYLRNWNIYDRKMFPIDWVIVGGESGTDARPMHPDWARSIRDHCKDFNVPFFFKQHGEWSPDCLCGNCNRLNRTTLRPGEHLSIMFRCGKKAAGSLLDGKEYKEFPV